jgi:putative transport protein
VTVTRVRRGDDDLVADDDTVLELGDRVRVVGPRVNWRKVAKVFGDSERGLSEVDALGFALGIAADWPSAWLEVPLPGGADAVELGPGGGTLVVGLVLGMLSRTGPITWQIPHGANLVLRQIGILMFLAAAGLGSGTTFADAIGTRAGLELAVAGAVVAMAFAAGAVVIQLVLQRDVLATTGHVRRRSRPSPPRSRSPTSARGATSG